MDFKILKYTSKWKDEDDLSENYRFQDFSYILFKNNEAFYSEYMRNYRKTNNIEGNLVNEMSTDEESDDSDKKIKKNANQEKSTVCTLL